MKYYTCAYTSAGEKDLTPENLFDVERVIALKSANRHITDAVLRGFCRDFPEAFDEIIAQGTWELLSGIIAADRKFAIVSGCPEGAESIISLDDFYRVGKASLPCMPEAMESFYREAKSIHDKWERIYIDNMDFARLDSYCHHMISSLIGTGGKAGTSKVYKRFFGTTTVDGTVNLIGELTSGLARRYFIKGRPGTGKSTFLKKLSAALVDRGYDIEQYYCSFDPASLDMVVSRELSFCVFDSTAPHEKFPETKRDVILDFYEESGLRGVDEKYSRELADIKAAYGRMIEKGNLVLRETLAREYEDNMKELNGISEGDIAAGVELVKKGNI